MIISFIDLDSHSPDLSSPDSHTIIRCEQPALNIDSDCDAQRAAYYYTVHVPGGSVAISFIYAPALVDWASPKNSKPVTSSRHCSATPLSARRWIIRRHASIATIDQAPEEIRRPESTPGSSSHARSRATKSRVWSSSTVIDSSSRCVTSITCACCSVGPRLLQIKLRCVDRNGTAHVGKFILAGEAPTRRFAFRSDCTLRYLRNSYGKTT